MSGTNAAAVKAHLLGANSALRGLPGIDGVIVAYDLPRDTPRELVVGVGDIEGPVQLAAMKGDNGRVRRTEELSMRIDVRVYLPGQKDREVGDARAVEISKVIEEYIAANPTLGSLPALKKITVDNVNLRGGIDDDGETSVVTLNIGLMSFLT